MPIIFLDFDGVLHPEHSHESRHFCCLPVLQHALGQFADFHLVIASTWRLQVPLERLRRRFPPDLEVRIAGVTPRISELNDVPQTLLNYEREAECHGWLRANGASHLPWLAIDDRSWLYRPFCKSLFLVDGKTGLTSLQGHQLVARLRRIQ